MINGAFGKVQRGHPLFNEGCQLSRHWATHLIINYPDGEDVTGAVHHRQPRVHQHLPEQLDVALVFASQRATLFPFQDLDGGPGSVQQHRRQRGGEDETSSVGTHRVHQSSCARDVAAHAPECLSYKRP